MRDAAATAGGPLKKFRITCLSFSTEVTSLRGSEGGSGVDYSDERKTNDLVPGRFARDVAVFVRAGEFRRDFT